MSNPTLTSLPSLHAVPADATRVDEWEVEDDGTMARHFVGTEWFTSKGVSIHTSGLQRDDGTVFGRDVVISGVERATGGALTAEEAVELGRYLIALGHELRQAPGEARTNVMEIVA